MTMPRGLGSLLDEIAAIDPHLAESIRHLELNWQSGEPRDTELSELAANALLRGVRAGVFALSGMVSAFNAFAHDYHERQVEFVRSGEYRAKSYEEVRQAVYSNDEYMRTIYYPALLMSYVASPNYRQILRHLDLTLEAWRELSVTSLLEVAAGHAFLSLFALREMPNARGVATDISHAAEQVARGLERSVDWGTRGRFEYVVTDVLRPAQDTLDGAFDAAICCELLEHVPAPGSFLRAIRERLKSGGRLFLSAAVRMESVDHLTLFPSTDAVVELLRTEGFEVVTEMSVPFVTRRPRDEAHRQRLLGTSAKAATFVADCRKIG